MKTYTCDNGHDVSAPEALDVCPGCGGELHPVAIGAIGSTVKVVKRK